VSYGTENHKHDAYDVYGVADEHHRHYDLENLIEGLREDLSRALGRIAELEREASDALKAAGDLAERVRSLERSTPEARQAEYEADIAAADLAASGYDDWPPVGADRHGPGCKCPYCPEMDDEPEPKEYDPGPEADDEGGMTERRGAVLLYEEEL
jgi:hypothetical protein